MSNLNPEFREPEYVTEQSPDYWQARAETAEAELQAKIAYENALIEVGKAWRDRALRVEADLAGCEALLDLTGHMLDVTVAKFDRERRIAEALSKRMYMCGEVSFNSVLIELD